MGDFLSQLDDGLLRINQWRVLAALMLTMLMAQVLSWHYLRFAQVLSNKRKFARIFVLVSTVTMLVITIVGSSLALSLGLVGAMSIVRFRTPIKEPEELAYLFLAIGVGIGMGAGAASKTGAEFIVTLSVFAVVLAFLSIRHYSGAKKAPMRTVVQISVPPSRNGDAGGNGNGRASHLKTLLPIVEASCDRVDLRRVDSHQGEFNASLLVELKSPDAVEALLSGVQRAIPDAMVSVVERDALE